VVGRCRLHASGSGYRPIAGSSEQSNEPLGSIQDGGFTDYLSDY
jgi:hypothetical protein